MNSNVRARFAPSPTGYLHIGSLRTLVFNYLISQKLNGKLILRIEDTDQKREVEDAKDQLVSIVNWLGIEFDEGPHVGGEFGPYIQSERSDIYNKYAQELIEKGKAYRCFCSPDRLQEMREEQQAKKQAPKYDKKCRSLNEEEIKKKLEKGEKFVIRQKMPTEGEVVARDFLRGEIKFKAENLEDHVLVKSDGIPTYQFASVVDDHEMKISHVLRGEEWLPSFPKNILLYKSFGWNAPEFIHMPLIMDKNGGKLSKRKGDVAVEDFKSKGYLPEALINFTALLGWHPKGDESETLSLSEIIDKFEINDMRTSSAVFDMDKLDYFNGYHIRQLELNALTDKCMPYLKENIDIAKDENKKTREYVKKVVSLEQERLKKLSEIGELTSFFFKDELDYDSDMLVWKKSTGEEAMANLEKLKEILNGIKEDDWIMESLEKQIFDFLNKNELKPGNYLWPLRVALTGEQKSPGPFEVAEVLGKQDSVKRIEKAIRLLDQ